MTTATNAVRNVWHHAATGGDRIALREGDRSWTFAELRDHASGAARELAARGVGRGDRVLVVLPTSAEFVFVDHGLLALGATAVTVNTLSAPRELEYFLEDGGCTLAIGWADSIEALTKAAEVRDVPVWTVSPGSIRAAEPIDPVDVDGQEPAVLLYTSGTTGRPKGAVLTHDNLLDTGAAFHEALGFGPDDRVGTALPLFHVFGQASVMWSAYTAGASLSLLRPFSGKGLLEMAAQHQLTSMSGVPTMWNEMLHADTELTRDDFSHLRMASSGGAALPVEVGRAFKERFGADICDGYGLSETTGAATVNLPEGPRREGSVGLALPGVRVAILDEHGEELPRGEVGEVAIDGPIVMREYWNRPDATEAVRRGPWFLSGDLGRMDEDGFLFIVDRKKDLIIRGGYNVYPREVEEVLYTHPTIREAAVVGVPDERLGEEIAAVITPEDGQSIDAQDLRAWLGERLAAYKVPRIYEFVHALPKGATGKILKREIDRDTLRDSGERPQRTTGASS